MDNQTNLNNIVLREEKDVNAKPSLCLFYEPIPEATSEGICCADFRRPIVSPYAGCNNYEQCNRYQQYKQEFKLK